MGKINLILIVGVLLILAGCMQGHDHGSHSMEQIKAQANVITNPSPIQAGELTSLTAVFKDDKGKPLYPLMTHHGRKVHMLIISEDLGMIAHLHPDDFNTVSEEMELASQYEFEFTFPKAGKYIVALDVMNNEGAFSKQFVVNVEGAEKLSKINKDLSTTKIFQGFEEQGIDRYVDPVFVSDSISESGYTVKFSTDVDHPHTHEEVTLSYHIEKDNVPVTDLVPFLDAPMHFGIVKAGLDGFMHTHGGPPGMSDQDDHDATVPDKFGPDLEVKVSFPEPGLWQIFGQIKHENKIIFTSFMMEVIEGHGIGGDDE
tara:strand:- start:6162 stop:7103 length:942 start_codon:yes stop_codon:yes gene_type:complete